MKSMFRSRSLASAIAIALFLSTFHLFGAAPAALAATIGPIPLPAIGRGESHAVPPFGNVAKDKEITVSIKWRTLGSNDLMSQVKAELILLTDNRTVVETPNRYINNTQRTERLRYTPRLDDLCPTDLWLVKVRNISEESNLDVEAIVTITYTGKTQDFMFTTNPPGPFTLEPTDSKEREFNVLSDVRGTLRIDGIWNPHVFWAGLQQIRIPLRLSVFRVIRPDGSEVPASELQGVTLGFAQNSGASSAYRLKALVTVRDEDVGGTIPNTNNRWRVILYNPNPDPATEILLSFKFTPQICQ